MREQSVKGGKVARDDGFEVALHEVNEVNEVGAAEKTENEAEDAENWEEEHNDHEFGNKGSEEDEDEGDEEDDDSRGDCSNWEDGDNSRGGESICSKRVGKGSFHPVQ